MLLFSINLFFAKKGNKTLNVLLSLLFFARFGQILISALIAAEKPVTLVYVFQAFTPLYYAAPACFYLYISGFINKSTALRKWQWLHFIPALLALIHVLPWQGWPELDWATIPKQLADNGYFSLKTQTGLFPNYFHYTLRPILVFSYLCLAWVYYYRKMDKTTKTDEPGKRWIVFFLRVATFFQLLSLTPVILRGLHISYTQPSFVIINCLSLLFLVLYALHKPYIFYGYLLVSVDLDKKNIREQFEPDVALSKAASLNLQPLKDEQIAKPTKKVNLSEEQLAELSQSMGTLMEQEQLYLLHEFQIIDLAAKLNIPVHHCSYIINNTIGKNFRDWINGYRVEHFLVQHPIKSDKLTIEAIASESGFKSLATFYNAFKKEKGVMPTNYFNKELS
ncbi:AraC family transcriptional regulator [Pedobacter sp. HDW13]|uniref:helix-turn-helix domain-containing protein n=1 Tax=Pedobacter sp. HDW13 TaxID=2714940 RepID=UPI00140C0644|nr:helix-turn-helix domain-containing protein [Pedobacter sp. HDW13]QIL38019.1 AraC family transcriptional regulator [Pedobacter sp. HDW13]